jgi:hypothetical protein
VAIDPDPGGAVPGAAGAPGAAAVEVPPEPEGRLAPEARTLWRISGAGSVATLLPVPFLAGRLLPDRLDDAVPYLWGAWLLLLVLQVGVVPELLWRRWRYAVRADEIDIRRGAFTVTRTIVPMRRVQHVDTEQGPIQSSIGDVATIAFHTAAGRNEIPHLRTSEAARVRDRILELTKAPDEL